MLFPLLMGQVGPFLHDRLGLLTRLYREQGDLAHLRLGPMRLLVVNAPELVAEMLIERAADFAKEKVQQQAAGPILGTPINNLDGDAHRRQRRLLSTAFSPPRFQGFTGVVVEAVQRGTAHWTDGARLDLAQALPDLTLRIAGQIVFGIADLPPAHPIRIGAQAVSAALDWRTAHLVSPPLFWPSPTVRRLRHQVGELNAAMQKEIDARRAASEVGTDLLSAMMAARAPDGAGLSDRELRDNARVALIAAYDNTATGVMWSLDLLARHPEAYHRLIAETDHILGRRDATAEDLPRLAYTGYVLKETLRLRPVAPLLARQACRDTRLGPYPIRKGATVLFSPWVMHHRADCFPDPERFSPERFAPENAAQTPRSAYLPFGAGARACLGGSLAMLIMTCTLATLAQKWRFETEAAAEPIALSLLRARGGLPAGVRAR